MLCELCQCEPAHNFHHFIPRTVHSNKWFKKRFTGNDETRMTNHEVNHGRYFFRPSSFLLRHLPCRRCHRATDRIIPDEKELGRHYHTVEKLLGHEKLARYVAWKRSPCRRRSFVR